MGLMKLLAFKVDAFLSISATGGQPFSKDRVDQNESGKSAILDPLHVGFCPSTVVISSEDFRRGEDLPSMALELELTQAELASICESCPATLPSRH